MSRKKDGYVLRLYITGATHHSMLAVKNAKIVCDKYLKAGYSLEIIDVYQQPHLAAKHDIIAAPTLIKFQPLPIKRLVGDLSDTGKVLLALDIVQEL